MDDESRSDEVRRGDGTRVTSGYIDRVRAEARDEAEGVFEAEAAED